MDFIKKLQAQGGTVVTIVINGVDFISHAFRESGVVEVYGRTGIRIASAQLDDSMECVYYDYACDYETGECLSSSSTDLYHEHCRKTEHDLAVDLGTYLAAISFL